MSVELIKWIQALQSPFWDAFFQGITLMGESVFYILILSLIYWCFDKYFARTLVGMLLISTVLNGVLKEIINAPRPIGVEGIRSLRVHTAEGASFPSGHTQTAAVFFFGLSTLLKKRMVMAASIIVVSIVALSRLYLGVHWPIDVAFGMVFGAVSVWLGLQLIVAWEDEKAWKMLTLFFAGLTVLSLFFLSSSNYIKALGTFWAFWMGERLERRYVNFATEGSTKTKTLRYVLGILTTLVIYGGLKVLFPEGVFYSGIRYFLTVLNVVFMAPWLFKKLKWVKVSGGPR